MRTILCFGDSNTWGFIPGTPMHRYPPDTRWPGVLAAALGDKAHVIEEALCGRTTSFDDPCWDDRNGRKQLPFLLESHMPIDLVIIMLGTNDLKHYLDLSPTDIAIGAEALIKLVLASTSGPEERAPEILLIAPPAISETMNPFGHKFDGAISKSHEFGRTFGEIAKEHNVGFFDASTVVTVPDTDGVHMDRDGHKALGDALANILRR